MHRFFAAAGRFAVRFRWLIVVAWAAATIAAHLFLPSLASVAKNSNASFLPASSPSMQVARLAGRLAQAPDVQRVRNLGVSRDGQAAQLLVLASINTDAPGTVDQLAA